MAGFLSRLRFGRDAEKGAASQDSEPQLLGHEAAHVYQQGSNAPEPAAGVPDKIAASNLDSDGNDVQMETLELSHEGLTIDHGSPDEAEGVIESAGVKYTMFNPDGTPVRSTPGLGLSDGSGDDEAMAIEKVELVYEKIERVPNLPTPDPPPEDLAQDGDDAAPAEFHDALITEISLPALDAAGKDDALPTPGAGSLAQDEDGQSEYDAWPTKWKGFTLDGKGATESEPAAELSAEDGDDAASPIFTEALMTSFEVPTLNQDDAEELSSTLEPIAEAEKSGSITFLSHDMKDELGDLDDDDPGVDDLL
jgi:hypothetical protein